jgi:hypothetical protein
MNSWLAPLMMVRGTRFPDTEGGLVASVGEAGFDTTMPIQEEHTVSDFVILEVGPDRKHTGLPILQIPQKYFIGLYYHNALSGNDCPNGVAASIFRKDILKQA